ncbi:pol polyprotein [Daphnia sinensis]|uniref:Pol polyprotein n=1 Tax=Daphnia sinensis TaxID=1820382 RepID=A0AAD5KNV0_9CRUS|nr:pol polyprotein [Daphnia sinensis]
MIRDNVIVPSNSAWAAPVVLVKKKDGEWRFCVDYRRLNAVTTKDVYPLPRIEDALSRMEGSRYFSILDMQAGYWQVEVDEQDRAKTAFITADGLFEFKVMPFGLTNAPATFQRMMDVVLAGLKWNSCLVYLDDIVVFAPTVSQHLERLESVLQRIERAGLKLKLSKCSFLEQSLKVLGFIVSGEGISADPEKISAMRDFPVPRNVKEVQSFLGLCSYYRRFVPNFARSFEAMKTILISPPILAHPRYDLPMEIHCDASNYGVGAVLVQKHGDEEHVIAYASRLLSNPEINYSVSEKECLALVWSVRKFRSYIWGLKIRVVTDHHSLCWLLKKRDLSGRLARWSLQLQDLDIEIVHRSGRLHSDADGLSRAPTGCPEEEEEIPLLNVTVVPVLQHGAPVFLISDRGKCLTANFSEELFKALQTNHLVTAAYHPQCNGLVERYNHTFAEMLSMYVNSLHNDWDGFIDFVTFAYNTSRQESTGFSPFFLLYGREAVLPIDVALGNNPEKNLDVGDLSDYARTLTTNLSAIREKVKKRMAIVQSRQKKRYDRRRRQVKFTVGDPVLVYRPIRKKGRTTKFLHRYFGPYRIVRRVSDLNYIVEPLYGKKKNQDCVHVSHLKPFRHSAPSGKQTSENQVKEKTPKVVRWCDQQSRAENQEQHYEKNASSTIGLRDERVGGHVLRSRRRLKSPTRLDL